MTRAKRSRAAIRIVAKTKILSATAAKSATANASGRINKSVRNSRMMQNGAARSRSVFVSAQESQFKEADDLIDFLTRERARLVDEMRRHYAVRVLAERIGLCGGVRQHLTFEPRP